MDHILLNAEQAIRIATTMRDAVAKELPPGAWTYNTCTLFVPPSEFDIVIERLGLKKETYYSLKGDPIHYAFWKDPCGTDISFQSMNRK